MHQPECDQFDDQHWEMNKRSYMNHKHVKGKEWKDDIVQIIVYLLMFIVLSVIMMLLVPSPDKYYILVILTLFVAIPYIVTPLINVVQTYQSNPIVALYAASELVANENKDRFQPVLDVHRKDYIAYSAVIDLENNASLIKNEVQIILDHRDQVNLVSDTFDGRNIDIGGKIEWRVFSIMAGQTFNESALKICPTLCKILKRHSNEILSCAISILPPRTSIPLHVGYSSGLSRLMLPLIVPNDYDNCYICINGETKRWTEGVAMGWDDNVPHKVTNDTDQERVVLYMNVPVKTNSSFVNEVSSFTLRQFKNSDLVINELTNTKIKL